MYKVLPLMGMLVLSGLLLACSSDSDDPAPLAGPNPDLNLNGSWTIVETVGSNNCGSGIPDGSPWDYTVVTVIQSEDGATITITDDDVSPPKSVTGTLTGNSIVGIPLESYPLNDDGSGGTITETAMSLTVDASGDTINGTISISWTDNVDSCSGKINVVATRNAG